MTSVTGLPTLADQIRTATGNPTLLNPGANSKGPPDLGAIGAIRIFPQIPIISDITALLSRVFRLVMMLNATCMAILNAEAAIKVALTKVDKALAHFDDVWNKQYPPTSGYNLPVINPGWLIAEDTTAKAKQTSRSSEDTGVLGYCLLLQARLGKLIGIINTFMTIQGLVNAVFDFIPGADELINKYIDDAKNPSSGNINVYWDLATSLWTSYNAVVGAYNSVTNSALQISVYAHSFGYQFNSLFGLPGVSSTNSSTATPQAILANGKLLTASSPANTRTGFTWSPSGHSNNQVEIYIPTGLVASEVVLEDPLETSALDTGIYSGTAPNGRQRYHFAIPLALVPTDTIVKITYTDDLSKAPKVVKYQISDPSIAAAVGATADNLNGIS